MELFSYKYDYYSFFPPKISHTIQVYMTGNKNYLMQHVLKRQTFGFYAINNAMKGWAIDTLKCRMTIMKPLALHKLKKKDKQIHLLTPSNKLIP